MDFNDSSEEAAFRAEVRAWLDKNATRRRGLTNSVRPGAPSETDELARAKEWQARKADAGWAAIHWPKKYGGGGGTLMQSVIYQVEEQRYSIPRGFFEVGLGMCGPTLLAWCTEEQKRRYLPKLIRGEEIWCQLFSEPAAGSDLAGLRTRVERDGSDWILNGQKVWTSGAYFSDYGIIVTRHDPRVQKHKGLTFFFIDLHARGVEVRRIKQISGDAHFCEVFFKDVRIPDSQRLGDVGNGWEVSLTTLMNERLAVGAMPGTDIHELMELARQIEVEDGPAIENSAVREKLADWYVQSQGLKHTIHRLLTALSKGQMPGPEVSILKLVGAAKLQDIGSFGTDLQDMAGILMNGRSAMDGIFQYSFLMTPGFRIAGGTDEILRNVIGERVLGLPPEIRVDKDLPFNEVATGKV